MRRSVLEVTFPGGVAGAESTVGSTLTTGGEVMKPPAGRVATGVMRSARESKSGYRRLRRGLRVNNMGGAPERG
jgi:hypothetical protein